MVVRNRVFIILRIRFVGYSIGFFFINLFSCFIVREGGYSCFVFFRSGLVFELVFLEFYNFFFLKYFL